MLGNDIATAALHARGIYECPAALFDGFFAKMGLHQLDIFRMQMNTVVVFFEEIVNDKIRKIEYLKKVNANLRQTRDLLLPKLISGKVDVSDLDIEIGET